MRRKNYFELLENMGFDASFEIKQLSELLNMEIYTSFNSTSLISLINDNYQSYKNRNNFATFDNFYNFLENNVNDATDHLFVFSEFLLDFFRHTEISRGYSREDIEDSKKMVVQNDVVI